MHVSTALDAIKKQGTFKAYKEAVKAHVEQRKAVKQAKAALALLTAPASKGKKSSEKASKKSSKKAFEKASQKTKEGVALADAPQSTRLSTRNPSLLQRLPRTSTKPLLLRCFSSMQICCLWMPSTC